MSEWDADGEHWIRWAREPGFDVYWYIRDAVFDAVLPDRVGRVLEVGCGEGRVTRDLVARGHEVVALDPAQTLVRAAAEEDVATRYLLADGAALPFPDGAFDTVVAYNVFQVVGDLPGSIAEVARVIRPEGAVCVCLIHPVTDMGRFLDDGRFVLRSDYFEPQRVEDTVQRDGMTMTFRGWSYSLEDYTRAFEDAGLLIERIREPRPSGHPEQYDRWLEVPLFLALRAVKR